MYYIGHRLACIVSKKGLPVHVMCSDRRPTVAAVNDVVSHLCALVYMLCPTEQDPAREGGAGRSQHGAVLAAARRLDGAARPSRRQRAHVLRQVRRPHTEARTDGRWQLVAVGGLAARMVSIDKHNCVNALHNVYCVPIVVGCLLQYLNQFKEVDQVVMKYALGDACVRVATNKVRVQYMCVLM